jgi:trk system potassium uptake protein
MRVIIIGGGKTTYFLARQFAGKGYYLTLINQDAAEARKLSRQLKATVIVGDGCSLQVQAEAQARQADIVIALLARDEDNLVACQLASEVYGVPRTIALINDPENTDIFQQLGVSATISAAQLIAQVVEEEAGFEDIINLMPIAQGRVNVTEILLTRQAPVIGKTLRQIALPDNSLVAAVIRDEEVIIPHGDTQLALYDRLLIITEPDNHGQVLHQLTGADAG